MYGDERQPTDSAAWEITHRIYFIGYLYFHTFLRKIHIRRGSSTNDTLQSCNYLTKFDSPPDNEASNSGIGSISKLMSTLITAQVISPLVKSRQHPYTADQFMKFLQVSLLATNVYFHSRETVDLLFP